ncbi:TolC family protein [Puniceicoccaceae bacterium K14]|nr:TolC family protein [Puniceicoccaceae bacterium K14]
MIRQLVAFGAFSLTTAITPYSFCQDNYPNRLSKDEAIQWALANNKDLAAARTVIEQVKGRSSRQGRLDSPEVSFSYGSDTFFNNEGEQVVSIGLGQRFPITNRLRFERKLAESAVDLARAEINEQERELIKKVEVLVVEAAAIQSQLDLGERLIELDEQLFDFIESRVEKGELSVFEANQVNIKLYSMKLEHQELFNKKIDTLAELQALLGMEETLEIDYVLDHFHPEDELPNFTETMVKKHPQVYLKNLLAEVAENRLSLARTNKWEDFAVSVFWKNERGVDQPYGLGNDSALGLGVSIPLPRKRYAEGAMKEEIAYKKQIQLELESTEFELKIRASALKQKMERIATQVEQHETEIIELADQNLEDVNTAYEQGRASANDVFRAKEQRLEIESEHLKHLYELNHALTEWRYTTAYYGPLFSFSEEN